MRFFLLLLLLISSHSISDQLLRKEPLGVDEAFILSIRQEGEQGYGLTWNIAADYYLYKHAFIFEDEGGNQLTPLLSTNHRSHKDQFFGAQQVYYDYAFVRVERTDAATLFVSYQGCWEQGLCYPVQKKRILLASAEILSTEKAIAAPPNSNYDFYLGTLSRANTSLVLFLFFLAGLGLVFTPCVLPMFPIISGTLTAQQSRLGQKLMHVSVFVLAMAITFSLFGMLSSFLGYKMQSFFASPLVLIALASFVILLALAMFDIFHFSSRRLNEQAQRWLNLTTGSYQGAVLWGVLSPVIIGSCLSAPLAAALIYLANQGNPFLGAAALFLLALGMGIPLILFALGFGKLSSGPWLEKVKSFFGFMLLFLALFILFPLLPAIILAFLSAALFVFMLWSLFSSHPQVIRILSFSLLCGILAGGASLWIKSRVTALDLEIVSRLEQLRQEEREARQREEPVMIYYSADWCISCRELDWLVLRDKEVMEKLSEVHFIKADLTHSGKESQSMLNHHKVMGAPTFVFIDDTGKVRKELRLVGNVKKGELIDRLNYL